MARKKKALSDLERLKGLDFDFKSFKQLYGYEPKITDRIRKEFYGSKNFKKIYGKK